MDTHSDTKSSASRIPILLFIIAIPFLIWAWYQYPHSLTFAGIFWATLAGVFGSAFILNRRKKTDDTLMKQKMEELQQQGTALYYETEAPLSMNDVAKLLSTIRKMYVAVFVIACIGWAIIYFLIEGGVWSYGIFGAVLLLIMYAIIKARKDYMQIAKEDKKTIFRGIITHRFKKDEGSGEEKTTHYFVRIGEREFKVEQNFYDRYPVGTAAEIHFAVSKGMGLFIFSDRMIPLSDPGTDQKG